jgi:rhodanese-related sulfurtransferase
LRELADRVEELKAHKAGPTVVVCRSGVRSTTAAAILEGLGFDGVFNLQGGMVDWNDRQLPVERKTARRLISPGTYFGAHSGRSLS